MIRTCNRRGFPWVVGVVAALGLLLPVSVCAEDPDPVDAILADDPAAAVLGESEPVPEPAPEPVPPPAPEPAPPAADAAAAAETPAGPAAAVEDAEAPPPPSVPPAPVDDPAEQVLTPAPDPAAEVLGGPQAPPPTDSFDDGMTEPTALEQRQTFEASVSVQELLAARELGEGILIRRKNKGTRAAPARLGFTGVYRTISADLPVRNSFRFGSHFSFYSVSGHWDNTSQDHLDAIGFFSYSVRDDLEVRIAGMASGHASGTIARYGQGALFQALGDVYLGAKYIYPVLPFLTIGGVFDIHFYTRVGEFLLRGDATSFDFNVVSTLDLNRTGWFEKTVPVRVHFTTGYNIDRSSAVVSDLDLPNASTFGGFGLSAGDQIPLRLAVDFQQEPLSYFLEYSAEPVVNTRTGVIQKPTWNRSPQRFTVGARYNPYENILLDAAVDISAGLQSPVRLYGRSEPVSPPYQLHFGLTYEWNPTGFEIIDLRGEIVGIVVDADTGEPLGGAIVEYVDAERLTPQVADMQTGTFRSYQMPPGEMLLRIRSEGYEPVVINPEVIRQESVEEKVFLRRLSTSRVPVGALVGSVVDEEGAPVVAEIHFRGTDITGVRSSSEDGSFIKILPEGEYEVEVAAAGFETKVYRVPVMQRKRTRVVFQLLSGRSVGALAGSIRDEENRPVAGSVFFLDAQLPSVSADATGQFMRVVPPGEYALEVRARGYMPRRYRVPVEEGRKTMVDVILSEEQAQGALSGRILGEDGAPLPGVITFALPGVPPVPADPETGRFEAILQAGTYEIQVDAPGYEPRRFRIPVLKGKRTVQDFQLQPDVTAAASSVRREADRLVFDGRVDFEPGTALLTESAYVVLNAVARQFQRLPLDARLEVGAHTSNLGPASANQRLSQARADAVQDYLIGLGLPPGRIDAVGYGEDQPIADNATPEGRMQNERVTFRVLP